jgi:hypothetical protein
MPEIDRAGISVKHPGGSDSFLGWRAKSLEREGRKARPTPTDLRSVPAEVHAFESHPSHFSRLIRAERGEERGSVLRPVEFHQKRNKRRAVRLFELSNLRQILLLFL